MTRQDRARRSRKAVAVPTTQAEYEALTRAEFDQLTRLLGHDWERPFEPYLQQAVHLVRTWPPPDDTK